MFSKLFKEKVTHLILYKAFSWLPEFLQEPENIKAVFFFSQLEVGVYS